MWWYVRQRNKNQFTLMCGIAEKYQNLERLQGYNLFDRCFDSLTY